MARQPVTSRSPKASNGRYCTYSADLATANTDELCLRREDSVHYLGAGRDHRAQFVAVDQLGRAGLLVAGEAGDLLDWDAACRHDADEGVAQFPGNPVVAEARGLGDLAELTPDVVLVQHGADRRGEHQAGVLPQARQPSADPRPGPPCAGRRASRRSAPAAASGATSGVLVSPPAAVRSARPLPSRPPGRRDPSAVPALPPGRIPVVSSSTT